MSQTKTVSFSELDAYRQCRLKWWLAYKHRWQPPETPAALSRGKLFHEVMETHYNAIKDGEQDPSAAVKAAQLLYDPTSGGQSEEQALVAWIYEGYCEEYGLDPDWEIMEVEHHVEEWLPTEKGTRSHFRLKGKIDVVVRDHSMGGGLWLVDHKTARRLPTERDIDFDDQMGVYIYLLRRRGWPVKGAIYNVCRSEKLKRPMEPGERWVRRLTVRQDAELETMAMEVLDTFREAYRWRKEPPRSPDPDRCGWRCPYTEPCLGGRKGLPIDNLLGDHGFEINLERH